MWHPTPDAVTGFVGARARSQSTEREGHGPVDERRRRVLVLGSCHLLKAADCGRTAPTGIEIRLQVMHTIAGLRLWPTGL